jgi:SAM-dependent methyltransferase
VIDPTADPVADPGGLYRAFVRAVAGAGASGPWTAPLTAKERRFIEAHLHMPRVLVAGCGFGRGIELLLSLGAQVVALDREAAMTRRVSERLGASAVVVHTAEIAEAAERFGPAAFDSVVALGLVSGGLFLPSEYRRAALSALRRVLRPDGVLLLDFSLIPGGGPVGRVEWFDYPLGPGSTVPGCCYRPTRGEAERELYLAGFTVEFTPLLHDPAVLLTGARCRPYPARPA